MKKEELRIIIPFNAETTKDLIALINVIKNKKNSFVKINDVVTDLYVKEDGSVRLREIKHNDGRAEYLRILGSTSNKVKEPISKEEFENCNYVFKIKKDVLGVLKREDLEVCVETIRVKNRLYFSMEIEDVNPDDVEIENILKPFFTYKSLFQYFNEL
jgi:hypothetical protein